MSGFRSVLGDLHLATGFVALAAFWFPLFTRKGGRFHRTAGQPSRPRRARLVDNQ